MEKLLDLYTDYLISNFGQTTATGLAKVIDNKVSHDKITRLLSNNNFTAKDLWLKVKDIVRKYEQEDNCLIFDDTIIEKPYTDENEIMAWHWDHSKGRSVKGINVLNVFYHNQLNDKDYFNVPVDFQIVSKTIRFCDLKTRQEKRKSPITKNEMMRSMIQTSLHNHLKFKYILADSWFASVGNIKFISQSNKKFIFALKTNRLVAMSELDKKKNNWQSVKLLNIRKNTPIKVWLKDLSIPVYLNREVFINKDGSTGERYLISNDFDLSGEDFTQLYKRRWSIEVYHKSLKQNVSVSKSPTRKEQTQRNHFFAAVLAFVKLEKLRLATKLNHFAMKLKLYTTATQAAFKELENLNQAVGDTSCVT